MAGVEHEPGSKRLNRKRRAFLEAHRIGEWNYLIGVEQRVLRVALKPDPSHAHPGLEPLDARRDFVNYARRFHPGRVRQLRLDHIIALTEEIVGEVDSDGMIAHPHHVRPHLGLSDFDELHDLGTANLFELNRFHNRCSIARKICCMAALKPSRTLENGVIISPSATPSSAASPSCLNL